MGKTSGGNRQNLRDVVNGHGGTPKHIERTPIAVPKGTGRPRAGRGTKQLLGHGSRGKDERGDEPQGCASRRAPGARQSRSLFRKERVGRELDEELNSFLDMAAEEKMNEGMSRKDALRAVRLERGNLDRCSERNGSAESWTRN